MFDAHASQCTGIAFSPMNALLMCSCGLDGNIHFFDTADGKKVKTMKINEPLSTLSFCIDGHTLATGTLRGKILVYDLKDTKNVKLELAGQEGKKINSLAFTRLVKQPSSSQSSDYKPSQP
jgi:protein NEDD1